MYLIQQITSDSYQQQTLVIPGSSKTCLLQMYFMPMQYAWVITKLKFDNFTLTGLRITNSPNLLQQYRNQLPFGLACFSTNSREPTQQQDFSSGNSVLYLLSASEVKYWTNLLEKGVTG